ncbi:MAG: hypothetical protein ACPIOQ_68625 [Promethearchaeia archaeon]
MGTAKDRRMKRSVTSHNIVTKNSPAENNRKGSSFFGLQTAGPSREGDEDGRARP